MIAFFLNLIARTESQPPDNFLFERAKNIKNVEKMFQKKKKKKGGPFPWKYVWSGLET
jgi:hypothetical protein